METIPLSMYINLSILNKDIVQCLAVMLMASTKEMSKMHSVIFTVIGVQLANLQIKLNYVQLRHIYVARFNLEVYMSFWCKCVDVRILITESQDLRELNRDN